MKENGKKEKDQEMELHIKKMEIDTKGIGKMIIEREMEFIIIKMEINSKENAKIIKKKGKITKINH